MKKTFASQILFVSLTLALSINVLSQTCPGSAGCLDESFGTAGVASYLIDPDLSLMGEMVVQNDGKIVATVGGHKLVRINSDGSLDQTFGSGGVASFVWAFTSGSTTYYGDAFTLALQDVGGQQRIIVAGRGHFLSGRKVVGGMRVGRFMPDGSVDTSFGMNGSVVINTAGAHYVKVQEDGKILVLSEPALIARLTSTGSLDTSFGSGGLLNAGSGFTSESFHTTDFMVDSLGRILVSGDVTIGNGNNKRTIISVKRYSSAGIADNTFGTSGSARADFGRSAFTGEVVIDPVGNIVVRCAVNSPNGLDRYFAMARFTSNGLVDTSLAGTGKVMFLGGTGSRRGIIFQDNGKIVLTGRLNEDYGMVRYNYDGTLDSAFGSNGSVMVDIDGPDLVEDTVMQIDPFCSCGKIVMGGNAGSSPANSTFARFIIQ
jgi:uncharacterized delta-60 repeat protein